MLQQVFRITMTGISPASRPEAGVLLALQGYRDGEVTVLARSTLFGLGHQSNLLIPSRGGLLYPLGFVNRLREASQGTSALCQQGN